jgi:hypothetical protein
VPKGEPTFTTCDAAPPHAEAATLAAPDAAMLEALLAGPARVSDRVAAAVREAAQRAVFEAAGRA